MLAILLHSLLLTIVMVIYNHDISLPYMFAKYHMATLPTLCVLSASYVYCYNLYFQFKLSYLVLFTAHFAYTVLLQAVMSMLYQNYVKLFAIICLFTALCMNVNVQAWINRLPGQQNNMKYIPTCHGLLLDSV